LRDRAAYFGDLHHTAFAVPSKTSMAPAVSAKTCGGARAISLTVVVPLLPERSIQDDGNCHTTPMPAEVAEKMARADLTPARDGSTQRWDETPFRPRMR
jgi:hypothetical protein